MKAGTDLQIETTAFSNGLKNIPVKNLKDIAYRRIDDQVVIVNLKEDVNHILNTTAAAIWSWIDGKSTVEDIAQKLSDRFEVDQKSAKIDCLEFIKQIASKNLVVFPSRSIKETDGLLERDDLLERATKKKIPLMAHLDLTYRCNLDCVHCYVFGPDKERTELTNSEIKDAIEQLADAGTLYLTLSGGEVLTRKDFFNIASYARKRNFAIKILTNGTLMTKEDAEKIASLNPQFVGVSIYSANPEVHDAITSHSGSFQKSLLAVTMLRERGVRVRISTLVMKKNMNDYQSVHEIAQRLGAQFQVDYRIAPKLNNSDYPYPSDLLMNKDELRVILADIAEGNGYEPKEFYQDVFNVVPCGAGYTNCYISPYGDIYPCVLLPLLCGSLRKKTFIDIWKRSYWIRKVRSAIIPRLPCSRCDSFKYCEPCLAFSYFDKGDIFTPSERICTEAKIRKNLNEEKGEKGGEQWPKVSIKSQL